MQHCSWVHNTLPAKILPPAKTLSLPKDLMLCCRFPTADLESDLSQHHTVHCLCWDRDACASRYRPCHKPQDLPHARGRGHAGSPQALRAAQDAMHISQLGVSSQLWEGIEPQLSIWIFRRACLDTTTQVWVWCTASLQPSSFSSADNFKPTTQVPLDDRDYTGNGWEQMAKYSVLLWKHSSLFQQFPCPLLIQHNLLFKGMQCLWEVPAWSLELSATTQVV